MEVRDLFEMHLRRRNLAFSIDPESGRHAIEIGGGRMLVSLENLQREVAIDGDTERVSRFIDTIVAAASISDEPISADRLYWCLERNDYEEPADFRVELSDRVDRVLVHLSPENRLITWVTPEMLQTLGLSEADAAAKAFTNLAHALNHSTVKYHELDDVRLGFIETSLPFKSSLILAPNLREIVGAVLGWPLCAVVPDRDFLYLWEQKHTHFVQRVGGVVVQEYLEAAYPISTEVYELTDDGIIAIGEFPTEGYEPG